jgi:hypothetical protein
MTNVDGQQDARLDRLDNRLRAVEEVVIELRAITKMVKPVLLLLAASLGVDVAPMLV